MIASYKAIEFTADHTKRAREKSTFILARCGRDGTDEADPQAKTLINPMCNPVI